MKQAAVQHRTIDVDGVSIFYREAGPPDAPVVLLPHGYPCSSYEFRNVLPALGDRWRLIAPDFPGSGYSGTPGGFSYDFDGFAAFLERYCDRLGIDRCALYLHDFGSQIGLRFAMRRPERIAALIIQNGDIYEDTLGPKYEALKAFWRDPSPERRVQLGEAVNLEGFRDEFVGELRPDLAAQVSPDLWTLHWALMTPERQRITVDVIAGLRENRDWFPRYQAYLREHRPPALVVWGPQDGYMPESAARAYLRDLPDAELHLLDGGHWLLETNLEEVVSLVRPFLERTLPRKL